ncbi:MAG: UDP-N-acetylmuramoyl-tripeptide--D-alanyl-D-alanine ligase [Bacteroidetes bacterium]|nr:UDP-N-acetylmuramoyl-tripeptide--D-alanyl-D-alanine ligase [Bacteroidota bacterium]
MNCTVAELLTIPHVFAKNCTDRAERVVERVMTDSREARAGDVFVAFRGARVDAHDFVSDLCARGVLLCVVENRWYRRHMKEVSHLPLLVVRDSMRAYGDIARLHRSRFTPSVLAVTGSNGKTSTKEMIAAVLRTKFRVLQNAGNFNNHIGLPATLLQLTSEHDVVVVEMGTNQPGDIPYLCGIAQPSHGLITNIGRAHIEKLHTREGIAREKGALFASLPKDGLALVNLDEPLLREALPRRVPRLTFGTAARSDVRITSVTLDKQGRALVRCEAPSFAKHAMNLHLQAVGRHAAYNAAAALAAGFAFGCSVRAMKQALESVPNYDRRMQITETAGVTVINDTYNANPDSVLAAVDVLQQLKVRGRRCVVLADMLELGSVSRREHEAIGAALAAAGIPYVLTFGRHARVISSAVRNIAAVARHYTDKQALIDALDALLDTGDAVLVKGSRGMHMEEIVDHLLSRSTREEERV